MAALDRDAAERAVGQIQPGQPAGPDLDARQMPGAVLAVAGEDRLRTEKIIPAAAERPGRSGKFGRHRADSFRAVASRPIEIPPAVAIRHEIQDVVGRPRRLHDRFASAARRLADLGQSAVGADFGRPQPGAVPGHVGMVPAEPGEVLAVGAEARRAEEIVAFGQHPARTLTVQAERHDAVHGLALAAMVLAHREDAAAAQVGLEIGIAQAAGRGQRLRCLARSQPVQPLVGEIDRDDHAIAHQPGAAAILVHAGADIEARRGDVGATVRALRHQHGAAGFLRPRLGPVDHAAVERRLAEPDLRRRHQLRRDRRAPRSVSR